MRTLSLIGAALLVATIATGCQGTEPTTGQDRVGEEAPATDQEQTPEPAPEQAPEQDRADARWVMPDLVGTNLQDAQDQIQALTGSEVFFTSSHDLSGQDRNQVLDANWTVCTQNVAPGDPITADTAIDLGTVKVDEACP